MQEIEIIEISPNILRNNSKYFEELLRLFREKTSYNYKCFPKIFHDSVMYKYNINIFKYF